MAPVLKGGVGPDGTVDPKDVVTATAFRVSPELLGIPLASHTRRILAILVDLLLVALIANQVGGVVLGLLAAAFFFRVALRPKAKSTRPATPTDVLSTAFRGTVGCLGGVILFVTIVALIYAGPWASRGPGPVVVQPSPTGTPGAVAPWDGQDASPTREELEDYLGERLGDAMAEFWRAGSRSGMTEEGRERLEEIEDEFGVLLPWGEGEPGAPEPGVEGGTAEPGGDTLTAVTPDPGAPDPDAPDPDDPEATEFQEAIRVLEAELARERERRVRATESERETRRALAEARREAEEIPSLRAFLTGLAEDLGLGLGWGALYFSVFLTWWKGQTPGKKLFGLRVVRLDRGPLNWWVALERYGGYAAGFATGLLGFAQVYWDANRQATHDKIAGTVVIRDGAAPLPGFGPPPGLERSPGRDSPLRAPRASEAHGPPDPDRPRP